MHLKVVWLDLSGELGKCQLCCGYLKEDICCINLAVKYLCRGLIKKKKILVQGGFVSLSVWEVALIRLTILMLSRIDYRVHW